MSSNYVDKKITIWTRYDFSDDVKMKKVLKQVQLGKEIDDIIEDLDLEYGRDVNYEVIYDTEEPLTIEDNGNEPTIEVYKNNKLIGTNK